ncbi:MAG: hypothetical protein R3D00_27420 [Bacteroidia bacterium]
MRWLLCTILFFLISLPIQAQTETTKEKKPGKEQKAEKEPKAEKDKPEKVKKEKPPKPVEVIPVISRPRENWVFKSELDGNGEFLVVALDKTLWLGYDTAHCAIYKGWSGLGVVKRENEKFTRAEGYPIIDQPPVEKIWKISRNGTMSYPKTEFRGYSIADNKVTLHYALVMDDGSQIGVEESPEFVLRKKADDNRIGLERSFRVVNAPEGTDVMLAVVGESMLFGGDIKTDGKFVEEVKHKRHFDWGSLYDFTGDLKLNNSEPVLLKMIFTINPETAARGK